MPVYVVRLLASAAIRITEKELTLFAELRRQEVRARSAAGFPIPWTDSSSIFSFCIC